MKTFWIDVVGACNLSCPSCPVGNFDKQENATRAMRPELLEGIMAKAVKETQIGLVGLYNWTEPLIHPQIDVLINIVKSHGVACEVSTNLNLSKNLEKAISAGPDSFRISVSGFSQDNYGVNHKGGNIEVVKENMHKLAELNAKYGGRTRIHVLYHRYLGNMDDEFKMKEFASKLGFDFIAGWAYLMPVEKLLALIYKDSEDTHISEQDWQVIARLALPVDQSITASMKYSHLPCTLKENQVVIDCEGNTILCCTVFNQSKHNLGQFVDVGLGELQRRKDSIPACRETCTRCMAIGAHKYMTYETPELNQIGAMHVLKHYAAALGVNINS